MAFHSPFLIVYIGTSLFSVFIPIRVGYERYGNNGGGVVMNRCARRVCCRICFADDDNEVNSDDEIEQVVVIPWKSIQPIEHDYDNGGNEMETFETNSNGYHDEIDTDDVSYEPHGYEEPINGNNSSIARNSNNHNHNTDAPGYNNKQQLLLLSHQDHISMATKVAPIWFLSNYFYAMSLQYTSIASSTVLASMGSIFAFGFATCSKFGDERVTLNKLVGVALCFAGGVATAYVDVNNNGYSDIAEEEDDDTRRILQHHIIQRVLIPHISDITTNKPLVQSLLGDLAGLLSAIGYGAYTVLLRYLCPKDENRMSMQLFFGYVGLLNMMVLLPVALWVIFVSSNNNTDNSEQGMSSSSSSAYNNPRQNDTEEDYVHTTLTWTIFLFLILKGLLDNVLSDYLWARAVILTSATVASVGVGLTIPMAFMADWIMGNDTGTGGIIPAVFVTLGFVFVNIGSDKGGESSSSSRNSDIEQTRQMREEEFDFEEEEEENRGIV